MAGVELNPGPITPCDEKTVGKQDQCSPDDAHDNSTDDTPCVTQISYPTNPSQLSGELAAVQLRQPQFELKPGLLAHDADDFKFNLQSCGTVFTKSGSSLKFGSLQEAIASLKTPMFGQNPTVLRSSTPKPEIVTAHHEIPKLHDISSQLIQYAEKIPNEGNAKSMVSTTNLSSDSSLMNPLGEPELVEFSDYITYDAQERIALMLGFDLDKVEILRCKHRENVTGVSQDLLIDWMICNPQPTNRMVN